MNDVPSRELDVEASIQSAWQYLQPWLTWESFKTLANSNFTTALIGALAGAFAGAYAAQRVAERSKVRDELTKELRNVNATTTLVASVANAALALKKQHVASLKSTFEAERARLNDHHKKRTTGEIQGNAPYQFKADFRSMPKLLTPISTIQDISFARISATGRALSLVAAVAEGLGSLNDSIAKRNELIEDFKTNKLPPGADLVCMYFGLPYGGGHVNQEYPDTVAAIASYTDDVIFSSSLLCRDLHTYGLKLRQRLVPLVRTEPPTVIEVNFDKAKDEGILPTDESYPTWFSAFVTKDLPKHRWWKQ